MCARRYAPWLHHRRHARLPARGWVSRDGGVSPADPGGTLRASSNGQPVSRRKAVAVACRGRVGATSGQAAPEGPFLPDHLWDTSSVRPPVAAWPRGPLRRDRSGAGVGRLAHRADGTGVARLLMASSRVDFGQIVASRDGRGSSSTAPSGGSTDIVGHEGGDTTLVPLSLRRPRNFPALSPDGAGCVRLQRIGAAEVYVRPFPQTATASGSPPRGRQGAAWRAAAGAALSQRQGRDGVGGDPSGATFSVGKQRILFPASEFARPGPVRPSRSARRQAVPDGGEGEATQQSELVLAENWLRS